MRIRKIRPHGFVKKFVINRKYKDRLFQHIFKNKIDLLNLYNAVNHTGYTNPEDLEITTLDDVIYMSMKNDLSFIISTVLNLYEHQSSVNPNITIRGFMYFAKLYEAYIEKHGLNIYGSRQISLPQPQFVVFYNGRDDQPDEVVLKLSDLFMQVENKDVKTPSLQDLPRAIEPVLECKARVLNINYGHNMQLLESCRRLHDYSLFIANVNDNIDRGLTIAQAINMAIDTCIEQDVLADILLKNRSEVFGMLLTEYDAKKVHRMFREEGKTEGKIMGGIEATIELYQEFDFTKEQTLFKIMSKYQLSYDEASSFIDDFWRN